MTSWDDPIGDDPRVDRTRVERLSEEEYFWALMEPAWDEDAKGTVGQRALARTTYFIRDVENGGLTQAFWNFEPAEVERVLESLDTLGATMHAATIREALARVFRDAPPRTLEERQKLLEQKSREWVAEEIDPLDQRLYDETQLWPYFRRYIEAHPTEFFRE